MRGLKRDETDANYVYRVACVFIFDIVLPPLAKNQPIDKHEWSECLS